MLKKKINNTPDCLINVCLKPVLCCAGRTSDVLMRGVKIIEEGHLHKCFPNYQLPAFSLVS